MSLFLALGGERPTCLLLPAPECDSAPLQLPFWYFWSDPEKEVLGLSAEGLLYTFLLRFPVRY